MTGCIHDITAFWRTFGRCTVLSSRAYGQCIRKAMRAGWNGLKTAWERQVKRHAQRYQQINRFDAAVAPICDHAVPRRTEVHAAAQDVKLVVHELFYVESGIRGIGRTRKSPFAVDPRRTLLGTPSTMCCHSQSVRHPGCAGSTGWLLLRDRNTSQSMADANAVSAVEPKASRLPGSGVNHALVLFAGRDVAAGLDHKSRTRWSSVVPTMRCAAQRAARGGLANNIDPGLHDVAAPA